jgi:hypothetical protein
MISCRKNIGFFNGVLHLRGAFAQIRDYRTVPKLNGRRDCSFTDLSVRVGKFRPNRVQRI